jgi:hypothetical protein
MRRVCIALLATAGVALATPAFAQGVYIGVGPGIGVGIGGGYNGGYNRGYNSGYAPAYQYGRSGYRDSGGAYAYSTESRRCRTVMMETPNGNLRRVQRCS